MVIGHKLKEKKEKYTIKSVIVHLVHIVIWGTHEG